MKKACVIGWPISHSRSPLIHGYWLRKYGIDGNYDRIPVEPERLDRFLFTLSDQGFEGCNITIPHKERAFELIVPADHSTRRLRAVNTVYVRDARLLGTNTDGEGFIRNLQSRVEDPGLHNAKAVILGAGGAAAAIASALLDEGVEQIDIVNRSFERAEALQRRFGKALHPVSWDHRSETIEDARLLVNTTSLGMTGQPPLDLDLGRLADSAIVADIVYTPLRTALLHRAESRGLRVIEGLGMLLHQAVRGFELWFGVRPEVTQELYQLVADDIMPGQT